MDFYWQQTVQDSDFVRWSSTFHHVLVFTVKKGVSLSKCNRLLIYDVNRTTKKDGVGPFNILLYVLLKWRQLDKAAVFGAQLDLHVFSFIILDFNYYKISKDLELHFRSL